MKNCKKRINDLMVKEGFRDILESFKNAESYEKADRIYQDLKIKFPEETFTAYFGNISHDKLDMILDGLGIEGNIASVELKNTFGYDTFYGAIYLGAKR